MKKKNVIKLTETDLVKIVQRVITEQKQINENKKANLTAVQRLAPRKK